MNKSFQHADLMTVLEQKLLLIFRDITQQNTDSPDRLLTL